MLSTAQTRSEKCTVAAVRQTFYTGELSCFDHDVRTSIHKDVIALIATPYLMEMSF